jgi:hypothetical protein
LNLIGDAVAVVALVRLHDRVEAGLCVVGFEELRIARPVEIAAMSRMSSTSAALRPKADVAVDAPVVGHLADRGENFAVSSGGAGRGGALGSLAVHLGLSGIESRTGPLLQSAGAQVGLFGRL